MASVIGEAFVAIRPETAGFASSLKTEVGGASNAAANNMTGVFNTATTRVGKTFSGLGGILSSQFGLPFAGVIEKLGQKLQGLEAKGGSIGSVLSGIAGPAALGGVAVVGAIIAESLHLADDFEGAHARLAGAVKNVGDNFKDEAPKIALVNKQLENVGFTNTETESSLATLTRAAGSTDKALGLMGLAADISRARNISLESATSILAKVQTGHVALLGRYGIATKDAAGNTLSVDAAVAKLTEKFGGQAKTSAETFTGKMGVLGTKLEDVGIKIGVALIPIVEKMTDKLTVAVDWVTAHQDDFKRFFDDVSNAVQTMWTVVEPIYAAIWEQLQAAFTIIDGLVHGNFKEVMDGLGALGQAALDLLIAPFKGVYQLFHGFFDAIGQGALDGYNATLGPLLNIVIGKFEDIIQGAKDAGKAIDDFFAKIPGKSSTDQGGSGPIDFNQLFGFASGGTVPGVGNRDTVPAMLTPGEFVVKKDRSNLGDIGGGNTYITMNNVGNMNTETAVELVRRQRLAMALASV